MRLGGRLQAAIEILEDIDRRHRPVADALKDWGLSHRFAGSGDRAAIGNLVYDALRHKRSAVAMLGSDTGRAVAFGSLLSSGIETVASLDGAFEGDRFAPDPLNEDERVAISAYDPAKLSPSVAANVPDWCVDELQAAFGDDWALEATALAARPPLDLRANTLKATREKVLPGLAGTGAVASAFTPDGIRIPPIEGHGRHLNVQAEPAFQKGWFEVQDEGSQIVSLIAAGDSPRQVLDYCAGAGGKTLALAAAYANKGQIFAHDAIKQRLAPIFDRVKRAGCRNVQIVTDGNALSRLENRMDMVLVDAPCTGSGTWRRRPDAKWRLTDRLLEQRVSEQSAILDAASHHVQPGGQLVYVTCSVFPSENDKQVKAFLVRNDGFSLQQPDMIWPASLGDRPDRIIQTTAGLLMTPARTGTDGFFVAVMTRQ